MNILQSERIFEMQNEYLKHRTEIEVEIEVQNKEGRDRAILTQNKYLKYNTDFWDIEQIFQIGNKYLKYGTNI